MYLKLIKNKSFLLIVFLLAFYLFDLLSHNIFTYDALRFFSIDKIPGVYSLDYLLDIFSKGTNGPQYRPISFFIYSLVTKSVFGYQLWLYELLGFGIFLSILYQTFLFAKHCGLEKDYALLAVFICALNSNWSWSFHNDFYLKYHFNGFIFLYGLNIVARTSLVKLSSIIKLFFLIIIGILCHEGSITFPFIWLFYYLFKYKRFNKFLSFLLLPSFLYLILRIFILKIPRSNFMEVGFSQIFHIVSFYFVDSWGRMSQLLSYIFEDFNVPIMYFHSILLILGIIYYYKKTRNKIIPLLFLMTVVILLPFSVLPNHYYHVRGIWSYPLYGIAFALLFVELKDKFPKAKPYLMAYILITFIGVSIIKFKYIDPFIDNQRVILTQFKDKFNNLKLKESEPNIIEVHSNLTGWFFEEVYFPEVVASYAKKEVHILLKIFSHNELKSEHIIQKRARYIIRKYNNENYSIEAFDLFENKKVFQNIYAGDPIRIEI